MHGLRVVHRLAVAVAIVAVTVAIATGTTALAHPQGKTSAVVSPVKLGLVLDGTFAGFVKLTLTITDRALRIFRLPSR